jgi:hypothetical protein
MKPECSLNWHQVCLALGVHFTLDTALAEDNQKWSSIIKEKNIKLD